MQSSDQSKSSVYCNDKWPIKLPEITFIQHTCTLLNLLHTRFIVNGVFVLPSLANKHI